MSAFILNPDHIDLLVAVAMKGGRYERGLRVVRQEQGNMELDEWFGTEDTDYNLTVSEGVLRVTRYRVIHGQTITTNGQQILEVSMEGSR